MIMKGHGVVGEVVNFKVKYFNYAFELRNLM